jgi:hypothetical protein
VPITPTDKQKLDAIHAAHNAQFGGLKEDYFAFLYLGRHFKLDVEDFAHRVAFGGNDYGIDAYHIDPISRNLYLYQFKWSENHAHFKESMKRLVDNGLARIFGSATTQDAKQNDLLLYLKKELKEHRNVIERVYIQFVFKGDVEAAENSESLQSRREDLEERVHLINAFFNDRPIEFLVEFVADKPGKREPTPNHPYEVTMTDHIETEHDGRRMLVGFVPLMDLYRIHNSLRQQFFDRNIRASLSKDNAPNKKIREALDSIVIKAVESPSAFAFRHNGVTIAASKVTVADGKLKLSVPRLLNGAQTVSSLAKFIEDKNDNPLLKTNRDRLEAVQVIAKIIAENPADEFVTQVTISNNQQNPVYPWALRAMDTRQVDLADKFRMELGIFYSRQEGSFDNMSDEEREELGIEDSKDLRIRPMAQTLLAVQGEVYNMGHMTDVFESQKIYEGTFRKTYIDNADAKAIVLAYKTGLMVQRAVARIREVSPEKYRGVIPKARNLIWALLVQALFNHMKYNDLLDDYGSSLKKEVMFGDLLKQLAGTKVWPILKTLFASATYKDKVEQQNFEFVRTNDAYKRAMVIADDKFGWTKQSF